jgi:DNA-binding CsgD family transcriptional regulator
MTYSRPSHKTYIQHYKEAVRIFTCYVPEHMLISENKSNLASIIELTQLMKEFHGVVSVLDFSTQGYIYMSENVKSMLGYSCDDFYEQGIQKTISLFPEEHLQIIHNDIFPIMFDFFDRCATLDEIKDLRVTFNYNLFRIDGSLGSYLQQLSVIHGDECKKARIALMTVTDISDIKQDRGITLGISKKNAEGVYYPIFTKNYLADSGLNILSIREREILNLIKQGKSSTEISRMLNISEHTVYNHRKNMLKKMDAKNIVELLSKSITCGLL